MFLDSKSEFTAGTPSIGTEERASVKLIASAGLKFRTSALCRAVTADVNDAAKLGTTSVNISLPVSDIQIKTLNKTRRWVLAQLKSIIALARDQFEYVTIGGQDASRANPKFLNELSH